MLDAGELLCEEVPEETTENISHFLSQYIYTVYSFAVINAVIAFKHLYYSPTRLHKMDTDNKNKTEKESR